MHLAPGRYTFTTSVPFVSSVTYDVDADGIRTPFGKMEYHPGPPDYYSLGTTAVAVMSLTPAPGSFVATTPGTPPIAGGVAHAP